MARRFLFLHDNTHNCWLGDITPVSDAAKLFTMFYVLIGIGIIATFANLLIKQTMIKREIKRNQKDLK